MTSSADDTVLTVGLMTGTSLDGIDAALVELGPGDAATLRGHVTLPLGADLVDRLRRAAEGHPLSAAEWGRLGRELAAVHADAARRMAAGALASGDLVFVAAHGVTVSHAPDGSTGHSWQLLDGAALAAELGVPVVCDFRAADVARGGQGAPLAPLADLALRRSEEADRVILNLGGIANLTAIPAAATSTAQIRAGDVGPANMVLDEVCRRAGVARGFDEDGALAAAGTPDAALIDRLLEEPWARAPLPRSFGREQFGPAWVDAIERMRPDQSLEDRLATLVRLEARAVALFLTEVSGPWRTCPRFELYVTGGGRHNRAMITALETELGDAQVAGMEALGVHPDAKEAMDFAWLGGRSLRGVVSETAPLTGARENAVLGCIHPVGRAAS